ncbi:WD repeat domain phosphoinositide-interacting protein 2-like isoform X2 [Amphibalanus amphitrite]|uniref:WD repeat domain phosphoinositide-interacting protein 2-like isoform X2 n=1 Tax=Amphibalanus amphitrite TaxID=1232801 RepID=UPI001C90A2B1|nr:WD repeat domain phosphoinositide-interacting protein 2-like isoform X2 [Amphibalanus amphitrite]
MNPGNVGDDQPTVSAGVASVRFVNFNQDYSSLAVGTHMGYRLFTINSIDKIEQIYEVEIGDVLIVERLFSSSLVTLVTQALPRRLQVCHFKKGTKVCEYDYTNTIVAVRLNRARLVVCLEESLYIHNIRDMKLIHTIRDTPANPRGVCALSVNSDLSYLAYPGSATIGELQVFDALNLQAKTMLPAHDSPVAAVAFSVAGTQVATASEKGTVIRVFNIKDGSKAYELRRGLKRCAQISSMCFSPDAQFLALSSNTETIHVFRLTETVAQPAPPKTDDGGGWMGYLSKAVTASASYLPSQVTEVLNQGRAFATVHLPVPGLRGVCGLVTIKKQLRLLVAAADGYLYVYNVDTNEGGDCNLIKQHRLDGRLDSDLGEPTGPDARHSPSPAEPPPGLTNSYAGVLRGRASDDSMTESEKRTEMRTATETPPTDGPYQLHDEDEFPPMA